MGDIIAKLGGNEFARLRVGIGQNAEQDAADYVLARPAEQERELIAEAVEMAKQAVTCWVTEGVEAAMNKFNTRNE